jgi:hypothetical protein
VLLALVLAAAPVIDYRVKVSEKAEVLDVQVRSAAQRLTLDEALVSFVEPTDGGYRFKLGDAARAFQSRRFAFTDGPGVYAAPSTWLMHPENADPSARFTLHVETPKGLTFVTGLHRSGDGYEGPVWALDDAPWSGFAPFMVTSATLGGATIETALAPGKLALTPDQVRAWVARSVNLVAAYYGKFPVPRVAVMVIPGSGDGIGFGTAMGNGGAAVLVWVGAGADLDSLAHDWVLPHELIHFASPNLARRYTWLEEGLATYVEPVTRTREGEMTADAFWEQMVTKLPLGLPEKGDQGLDNTHTWGRTYWGGALFCFLADVELHQKGKGLEQALQGVIAAGGTQEVQWEIERMLAAGDAATGTQVLTTLHTRMGNRPGDVDLSATFKKLGVALVNDRVVYDDRAPLAAIRKAMTAKVKAP